MKHTYENKKYGRLEIEVIGPYQDVTKMYSKDFDTRCFFTIDEAEKIALITGNAGIQLGFAMWDKTKAFLLHHESRSSAAVCRIVSLDFDKKIDAREVLARPNPYYRHWGI